MLNKRTIIISNRLPIRVEKRDGELHFSPSEGGLATGLSTVYNQGDNLWIGWPGYMPENEAEKVIIEEKLLAHNLLPVFLTAEEIEHYYEGFSNEILWPIFHYRLSYAIFKKEYWNAYQQVNQKFADIALAQSLEENDSIWIHDYQLMLLPQLIRQQEENISIGYFQHIPFPPDEIFRCIPWRDELLKGLLGADLVAFHTFNDSQHFLRSCSNILGHTLVKNAVQCRDRTVQIEVFPMGIDFDKFDGLARSTVIQEKAEALKEQFNRRKIILSIDRLDYSKGILERLKAFELLLQLHPEMHDQVVMYMLIVPSRENVTQYSALRDEIDRMVGHINAVYGFNEWTPIAYFYNSYPLEDLSALYVAADVCLVTSLRDGMNLVAKEYVASKAYKEQGVLILSELAGAAKDLSEATLINPYSIEGTCQAILLALHMPEEEQRLHMKDHVAIVQKFNVFHWVKLFFERLAEIKDSQKTRIRKNVQNQVKAQIMAQYQESKKRLFFLDYDGTLIGFSKNVSDAVPNEHILHVLKKLQDHPDNQIVIISGRSHHDLGLWFGDKPYILVAEHGTWQKLPHGEWEHKAQLPESWKIPVLRIMQHITERTAGAHIEEKTQAIAWHYRAVQTGLGQMRGAELEEKLHYLISQYDLQVLSGDKVIEVKHNMLNKGKAALAIVHTYQPDFIFAIGDDSTDEDMFFELPETSITVKVGNKSSIARFYIESPAQVLQLINSFSEHSLIHDNN